MYFHTLSFLQSMQLQGVHWKLYFFPIGEQLICARDLSVQSMDIVYWMIGMSRFTPFHERRLSMWSLVQTEIKDLSMVRTKGATFFYKERASFTATWW